ncbi:MAG: hypothetical protein DMD94_23265 [Candidatus Rokuibacteriota bacterium]|nr:MAG: hypothetical protein DMD94_23265 [Candidatus Rokubacteria bacterium]
MKLTWRARAARLLRATQPGRGAFAPGCGFTPRTPGLHPAPADSLRARDAPLLGRHLLADGGERIPVPERERVRRAVWTIGSRNAFLTRYLVRVLEQLRAAGIMAVPFKGPTAALDA